jgi:adhesin/invasin
VDGNGKVSFTAEGNSTPVTITASLKTGGGDLIYPFTVTSWFINNANIQLNVSLATSFCSSPYSLPNRLQLVNVLSGSGTRQAGSDALWSEWGNFGNNAYELSGFFASFYWTNDPETIARQYIVRLDSGVVSARDNTLNSPVVCRKAL